MIKKEVVHHKEDTRVSLVHLREDTEINLVHQRGKKQDINHR